MSEIAAEAGIGKGTVYEYFKSKEELIGAAMLYNLEQLFARAEETLAGAEGFREGFYACVGMVREALQRRLSGVQMLVSELRRGELETYLGGRMAVSYTHLDAHRHLVVAAGHHVVPRLVKQLVGGRV